MNPALPSGSPEANHVIASRDVDELEAAVRAAYERCHPEDSFEDLTHRARFSKADRRLLEDWIRAIRLR